MILVEREPALPAAVETVKAQVLVCLGAMHQQQDFMGCGELAGFLDQLLAELVAVDVPRGLQRVLLFYRTPKAVETVAQRMLPGGLFLAFRTPACWTELGRKLPELRAWAERIEPGHVDAAQPRGI